MAPVPGWSLWLTGNTHFHARQWCGRHYSSRRYGFISRTIWQVSRPFLFGSWCCKADQIKCIKSPPKNSSLPHRATIKVLSMNNLAIIAIAEGVHEPWPIQPDDLMRGIRLLFAVHSKTWIKHFLYLIVIHHVLLLTENIEGPIQNIDQCCVDLQTGQANMSWSPDSSARAAQYCKGPWQVLPGQFDQCQVHHCSCWCSTLTWYEMYSGVIPMYTWSGLSLWHALQGSHRWGALYSKFSY